MTSRVYFNDYGTFCPLPKTQRLGGTKCFHILLFHCTRFPKPNDNNSLKIRLLDLLVIDHNAYPY